MEIHCAFSTSRYSPELSDIPRSSKSENKNSATDTISAIRRMKMWSSPRSNNNASAPTAGKKIKIESKCPPWNSVLMSAPHSQYGLHLWPENNRHDHNRANHYPHRVAANV